MTINPSLVSTFILGARPRPETEALIRSQRNLTDDVEINLCVFEVIADGRVRYCCWSGGEMHRDNKGMPHLTPTGEAALEALTLLPCLQDADGKFDKTLVFHELRLGKTPLKDKVLGGFRLTADASAVICFVGDLVEELNGHMHEAFNLRHDKAIAVSECIGMARPGEATGAP